MKIYNKLESLGFFEWLSETHNLKDTDMKPEYLDELPLEDIHRTVCNSMAFRWFRETYNIDAWVQPFVAQSKKNIPYLPDESYGYFIFKDGVFVCDKVDLLGPEEAELACLIELIKIAKENKQ